MVSFPGKTWNLCGTIHVTRMLGHKEMAHDNADIRFRLQNSDTDPSRHVLVLVAFFMIQTCTVDLCDVVSVRNQEKNNRAYLLDSTGSSK